MIAPFRLTLCDRFSHRTLNFCLAWVVPKQKPIRLSSGKKKDTKEPFLSIQQFARGQTAQLGYCQTREYGKAADAYRKALASGFTDKVWVAEAHHRLGLALEGQGH